VRGLFFRELYVAGEPGLWGPRSNTVLSVTALLFYVYWRPVSAKQDSRGRPILLLRALLAVSGYGKQCGSAELVQFTNDAGDGVGGGFVFMLTGCDVARSYPFFCMQAFLLTLARFCCGRGSAYNCFGSQLLLLAAIGRERYFGGWVSRWGFCWACLAVCLPVAGAHTTQNWGEKAGFRRLFVVPTNSCSSPRPRRALTIMLALKMRAGFSTVSLGMEGVFDRAAGSGGEGEKALA